jgi:hypothetical protein
MSFFKGLIVAACAALLAAASPRACHKTPQDVGPDKKSASPGLPASDEHTWRNANPNDPRNSGNLGPAGGWAPKDTAPSERAGTPGELVPNSEKTKASQSRGAGGVEEGFRDRRADGPEAAWPGEPIAEG